MKNNQKLNKKSIILVVLAILLGTVLVGRTIAWLTRTSTLTNTFTVGDIKVPTTAPNEPTNTISLDGNLYEPSWDASAEHKLVPGQTFAKDPYVGIGAGSEDAVVYVYVENNFSNKVYFTINNGWEAVEATSGYAPNTYTSGLFKYTAGLSGATSGDVWTTNPLFNNVVVDDTAGITDLTVESTANTEIVVSSFIHQANGGDGQAIDEASILESAKDAFNIE